MIFGRRRFDDLVRRQLDAFAEDEAELLEEAREAERAYDAAEREDAEEAYAQAFARAARKRFPKLTGEL